MTWPERLDREPARRLMRRWAARQAGVHRDHRSRRPPAGLVNRQFRASAPNRLWDADITVVRTWQGFCYTACCRRWPPFVVTKSPNDSNPADWLRTAHTWRCQRAGVGLKSRSITLLPN